MEILFHCLFNYPMHTHLHTLNQQSTTLGGAPSQTENKIFQFTYCLILELTVEMLVFILCLISTAFAQIHFDRKPLATSTTTSNEDSLTSTMTSNDDSLTSNNDRSTTVSRTSEITFSEECRTNEDGPAKNIPCVFPFVFAGLKITNFVSVDFKKSLELVAKFLCHKVLLVYIKTVFILIPKTEV
jgi:hypothetical protein